MISFAICLVLLVVGYFTYGKFVEKVFAPDDRLTPAVANADGVDFIVMPNWKVFLIQFLNIAGTGPIFGAIMGAKFGPSSYLWIASLPEPCTTSSSACSPCATMVLDCQPL